MERHSGQAADKGDGSGPLQSRPALARVSLSRNSLDTSGTMSAQSTRPNGMCEPLSTDGHPAAGRRGILLATFVVMGLVAVGCEGTNAFINKGLNDIKARLFPPPPRHWLDVLRDPDSSPDRRRVAYQKLADPKLYTGKDELRKLVIHIYGMALQAGVEEITVQAACARALGRFPHPESQAALEEGLRHPSVMVRADVMTGMGRIRQPGGCLKLSRAVLADADPDVRVAAAGALERFAIQPAVEALIAALSDDNVAVVHEAHQSLVTIVGEDRGTDAGGWRLYLSHRPEPLPATLEEMLQRQAAPRPRKWYELF